MIFGAPDPESVELYAESVTHGDPSYAGPLAGISLELRVFPILELEFRSQVDISMFNEHLALLEIALDVEKISQSISKVRQKN